MYIEISCLGEN